MKWFNHPQTLEDLKKQYKKLAVKYHPDMDGNDADMKEINAEYDVLFNKLKNIHQTAEGETYTSQTETKETANEFKDIINELIHLDNINIEICGSWLWLTGDTFKHKDILKSLKFKWSKSKKAWYFHSDDYKKSSKKIYTLDQIRDLYGSESIHVEPLLKLAIV